MNSVARALSRVAVSNLSSRKWVVVQSYATSTAKYKVSAPSRLSKSKPSALETVEEPSPTPPPPPPPPPLDLPRPSEIPFQKKVANSVSLIGVVEIPLQSVTAPDGKFHAGTAITVKDASSETHPLRIPVTFEGDLAHVAALHLKENDRVYIQGELVKLEEEQAADLPKLGLTEGKSNIQVNSIRWRLGADWLVYVPEPEEVKVHNVNFVEASPPTNVYSFLQTPRKTAARLNSTEGVEDLSASPWKDILDNPKEWTDYRSKKLDGSVKPKYPDFKRRDGGLALWLNRAPKWFLSALGESVFGNPIGKAEESSLHTGFGGAKIDNPFKKTKEAKPGDDAWRDLVENPAKWWDNRLGKKNVKAPDFKHKETGVALWISSAPVWVRSELPPPKGKIGKY